MTDSTINAAASPPQAAQDHRHYLRPHYQLAQRRVGNLDRRRDAGLVVRAQVVAVVLGGLLR